MKYIKFEETKEWFVEKQANPEVDFYTKMKKRETYNFSQHEELFVRNRTTLPYKNIKIKITID
jgi:hypothetical protein